MSRLSAQGLELVLEHRVCLGPALHDLDPRRNPVASDILLDSSNDTVNSSIKNY